METDQSIKDLVARTAKVAFDKDQATSGRPVTEERGRFARWLWRLVRLARAIALLPFVLMWAAVIVGIGLVCWDFGPVRTLPRNCTETLWPNDGDVPHRG